MTTALAGLRYGHVKDYLQPLLKTAGFKPVITPGPASNTILQKASPQEILFIGVGGGSGLTTEGLFDRPFISTRAVGRQNNFASAEDLALVVDDLLLAIDSSMMLGGAYALYVTRTGGAPVLDDYDSASRYHFTCSYIAEAATGR